MNALISPGGAYWIGGATIVALIGLFLFLRGRDEQAVFRNTQAQVIAIPGQVWDGDLQEFNNPLPRWWMGLFILTVIFAVVYLILYSGLAFGNGTLGLTSATMEQAESAAHEKRVEPIDAQSMKPSIPDLSPNPLAMATGQHMFLTDCAPCSGFDAGGFNGFVILSAPGEKIGLYGNQPVTVVQALTASGEGMTPSMPAAIGGRNRVVAVANYMRSFSGLSPDEALAAKGKPFFAAVCAGCHGASATENPMSGEANLSDRYWLFGSALQAIEQTVQDGRNGHMRAQKRNLDPETIHVRAVYVHDLSRGQKVSMASP